MIDIEKMFPFYKESKVIRSYNLDEFDLYNDRFIFETETNEVLIQAAKDQFEDMPRMAFKFYRIMPNDVYIFGGSDPLARRYVCNENRPDTVRAQITELDYGRLAKQEISLEEVDGVTSAVKKYFGGYDIRPLSDDAFIKDAILNESSELDLIDKNIKVLLEEKKMHRNYVKLLSEHLLTEVIPDDMGEPISQHALHDDDFWNMDPHEKVLRHYFENLTPTEKVPLLVGISGIGKSAIINDLVRDYDSQKDLDNVGSDVRKFGYRMVDLRVSFLSRLDVDGMKDMQPSGEGYNTAEPAATDEFITCTDEYLGFAREMRERIQEKIDDAKAEVDELSVDEEESPGTAALIHFLGKKDDSQKKVEALEKIRDKFDYASKVPVLFLDEITRSDESIRGAMTTIINQRLYGTRTLNECRIVAATNAPIGYRKLEDWEHTPTHHDPNQVRQDYFARHFLIDEIQDVAVLDRFDKLLMTPQSAYPGWLKWAKEKAFDGKGLHKDVLDFIEDNGGIYVAYDMTPIDMGTPPEERDQGVQLPTVHPTFRTWDYLSTYLYNKEDEDTDSEKYKTYTVEFVDGSMGKDLGQKFRNHLNSRGWKEYEPPEGMGPMDIAIEECLENGIPLSIVGASGIGKTSRVRSFVENTKGWQMELVCLSTKTRIDIMGTPSLVDLVDHIVEDNDPENILRDDPHFLSSINELQTKHNIHAKITKRAPDGDLVRRIKQAVGPPPTPLVLFFDEFNRAIDPVTQTAIFQAISDNHFAGVDFPEGLIKVVLAGNPGDNLTTEAGDVDASLIARTIHFRQLGYTEEDVDGFFHWSKREAWKELDEKDPKAKEWKQPNREIDGYEKGAVVKFNNKYYQSLIHRNIIKPGEYSSGMSQVLLEYLENNRDKMLDIIKAVERAAIDTNTTSTRSLKMLSDLIDNYSIDNTLSGTLLLPDKIDRDKLSDEAQYNDDEGNKVFTDLLVQMKRRMMNWAALKGGLKYTTRAGTSYELDATVEIWRTAVGEFIAGNYTENDREKLYTMTLNLIEIDQKIVTRRTKLLENKVDTGFAMSFLNYYNSISGLDVHTVTIEDLDNDELIGTYLQGEISKVAGGITNFDWVTEVKKIYDYWEHRIPESSYLIVLDYFGRMLDMGSFRQGVEMLLVDQKYSSIFEYIEGRLKTELTSQGFDPSVVEGNPIYNLVRNMGLETRMVRSFLGELKEKHSEMEASASAAPDKPKDAPSSGLHRLGGN